MAGTGPFPPPGEDGPAGRIFRGVNEFSPPKIIEQREAGSAGQEHTGTD